jgi:osmotically-inducible protein OsmY
MKKLFTLIVLSLSLQGCIFVVGAAAGATAAAVVYDHRKLELIMQDQKINNDVINKINNSPDLHVTHINSTTFNQVVLLTGEVPTSEARQQVEDLAKQVPNVLQVYNATTVQGPSSSLTRASDSWITTKIKTEMLATKGLESGTIKVITENGAVYLMGIVNHDQANAATDIARQVAGVQKVVKIFQYKD